MTAMPPADDDTRPIPAVPALDETQVIPPIAAHAGMPAAQARPLAPARPAPQDLDRTVVLRAVNPDADAPPAATPGQAELDRYRATDDPGFAPPGRTKAYDSEPGAAGYRGKHGDLIPINEGSTVRRVVRTVGEIMITCGLVLLLFAGYEIWGKAAIVTSHQHDLDAQLEQEWAQDEPTVAPTSPAPGAQPAPTPTQTGPPGIPPGGTLGRLYLPRLGKYWVVVEGVEPGDIEYAPGHYPGTAQPGEVGNFSVAGHRSPAIFWDLDDMRNGDPVVVETRTTFYIYRVTALDIVLPTAVEVVAPVPGHPGQAPSDAMLTLTTCNPKWDNNQRLVLHARLERSQPRSAGRPAEIGG